MIEQKSQAVSQCPPVLTYQCSFDFVNNEFDKFSVFVGIGYFQSENNSAIEYKLITYSIIIFW